MRSWFFPKRATEATLDQVVASGAAGGNGVDPIDGDVGYRPVGPNTGRREVPVWTQEKSRIFSIAAYRVNPMARAIVDTYTSFCVGDSGLALQCPHPQVRAIAERFWTDPRNAVVRREDYLRDHMLMGETANEMLVGPNSGVTRFSIIDPSRVDEVHLEAGNPLWHSALSIRGQEQNVPVVNVDDYTGLRAGKVLWWPSWRALLTDRRGMPFLSPVIDWLDAYDTVLSNLVDRTSLLRYLVWDVTLEGADRTEIDAWVAARGGTHVPPSGSVEVHNEKVMWSPKTADVGANEDTTTAKSLLTQVAAGAGLAKTWLADPEDANRATSLTMAEPVRRRVSAVQNLHVEHVTEMLRFAVDQAVAVGLLPAMVPAMGPGADGDHLVPASSTVSVTGPEIAAADAQVNAQVFLSLSQSLPVTVAGRLLSPDAARVALRKAWEQFVGVPLPGNLDVADADADALAEILDKSDPARISLKLA